MAKRFWYQSMIVLSDLPDYAATIRSRLSKYVSADSEVSLHGFAPGSFPRNYPGPDIAHNVLYQLHSYQFLLAAIQAEKQGYDAFVIGNVGSPLIREIRSVVDIPVVGYGDAAARIAGMYGRKFGIMVFNVERMESLAHRYIDWGLGDSFAGANESGVTFDEVATAHADPTLRPDVIRKVIETATAFVNRAGVDVLIPGEMPLNLLLADGKVSEIAGATVIDGLSVMMKTAEMLVDLRRESGMSQSRRGYYHTKPDPKRITELMNFYGFTPLLEGISTSFNASN